MKNNIAKFYMMIGLPSSSKSSYAKQLSEKEDCVIHSSDSLREELFGDINEQNKNNDLFNELCKRIKRDLISGKNVIMDSCNINAKRRRQFIKEIKNINCEKIAILMATTIENCKIFNSKRDRIVPEHVIDNMYKGFFIPNKIEGFDDIKIIWGDIDKYNISDLFITINSLEQDNKHHTLTIGKHCELCSNILMGKCDDELLIIAGLLHDIGKPEVKSFYNSKGEKVESATYYNHHNVSAYKSLFYLKNNFPLTDENILDVVFYIQYHMQPFFMDSEKSINKFKDMVGEERFKGIMLLHEADKLAK